MADLPKLPSQSFKTKLADGTEVEYTTFKVHDEKALFMAAQSENVDTLIQTIKNITQNSIVTDGIDVSKMSTFDLENMFLRIRAKSVGETIDVMVNHPNSETCNHEQEISVNIDDIDYEKNPDHKNKINLTDDIGIVMRYPTVDQINIDTDSPDGMIEMIARCIDSVWSGEDVIAAEEKDIKEWKSFIEDMDKKTFEKVTQFFITMPKLKYTGKYNCMACGEEANFELEGMKDFFTLLS